MSCDGSLAEVTPFLYVAAVSGANAVNCRQLGITLCIDASELPPVEIRRSDRHDPTIRAVKRTSSESEDHPLTIGHFFDSVAELIHQEAQVGGKTAVYCYAGRSRSPTFCIAYLVRYEGINLRDAALRVREVKPQTSPKPQFWRQLIEFESRLLGSATVLMNGDVADVFTDRPPDDSFENTREISAVRPFLFVCGITGAHPKKVRQLGITTIVDVSNMPPLELRRQKYPGVNVLQIEIDDEETAPIDKFFDQVTDMIQEDQSRGGKVLVHCFAGKSRSVTLCIAYLMKYQSMTLKEAAKEMKRLRYQSQPNQGFWKQLMRYEKKLSGNSTINLIHGIPDILMSGEHGERRRRSSDRSARVSVLTDYLVVCGIEGATRHTAANLGVSLLIDVSNVPPLEVRKSKFEKIGVRVVQIDIDDTVDADIAIYFDHVSDLIENERDAGGKVMVHCYMGKSRSVALCMAYLIKTQGLTLKEAAIRVKKVRRQTDPNPGFWRQLIDYEKQVTGTTTVNIDLEGRVDILGALSRECEDDYHMKWALDDCISSSLFSARYD